MQRFSALRNMATATLLALVIMSTFAMGYALGERSPESLAKAQGTQPTDTTEVFAPFWEAWGILHDNFVDPLDDNVLMEGALTGMMQSVGDPHTDYMSPTTFSRVNEAMSGGYEGIGASVRKDEVTGGLELVSIFDNSPAEAAGLLAGDQIVEVNGENVTALTQDEIVSMVRGPAGTTVQLGILRTTPDNLLQIDVLRDRIAVTSVAYEVLDGGIGYLRLSQFDFSSSGAMRDALVAMDADNLNGLILDVRGNPGGYLTTSIEVASAYVEDGLIVTERGPNREQSYQALGNAIATHVPMIVLVDQGSASASELIAGALQDRERATVVGMQTFGKGSVQTWSTLSNGGGIRVTVSRWYTPAGRSVSEVGITPDVVVPYAYDEASAAQYDTQVQAAIDLLTGVMQVSDYAISEGSPEENAVSEALPSRE